MMSRTWRNATGMLAWIAAADLLYAGPPLITDDPETPGAGNWEINFAFTLEQQRRDWEFESPLLDVNYGVGDNLQLKYEAAWMVDHREAEGARGGPGNSQLGVKWRFIDEDCHPVSASVYPQFEFNTLNRSAERGLVDRGSQFLLPFQMQRHFGPLVAYAEVGHFWREERPNGWIYGLALEYPLRDWLELVGEIHGESESDFSNDELFLNGGFKWKFHRNVAMLATAGRSVREPNGESTIIISYLGLQFTF